VLSRLKFLVPAVSVDFPPAFVRFCTPAHLVLFPIVSDPTPFSVIKCGSGNGKWFIPPVSVCFHYCARQGGRVTGRGRFTRAEKSATEFLSPLHTPFGGSVALYLGARGEGGLIFSLSRKLTLSWKVQPILTPYSKEFLHSWETHFLDAATRSAYHKKHLAKKRRTLQSYSCVLC
jgi:hypothetical protein